MLKKKKLNNKRIKIVDRIGFELIILHISRSTILCKVTYATADEQVVILSTGAMVAQGETPDPLSFGFKGGSSNMSEQILKLFGLHILPGLVVI